MVSPPPSKTSEQPAYYDADFEFSELVVDGETFMTSLPPFPPNPAELASLSQVGSSWTAFHSSHASAQFFKAKRYLPQSFSLAMSHLNTLTSPAILEVGCGAGAALFPLLSSLPPATSAIAIDIAPTAIELLRSQPKFDPITTSTHVVDISTQALPTPPSSIDVTFLVFCLSALPPFTFLPTLKKLLHSLRPGGLLCFRDYGLYDMTMLRFKPSQHVASNTFQRGDGTLSSFFELESTKSLFEEAGFEIVEAKYALVENKNKKTSQTMRRCFIHIMAKKLDAEPKEEELAIEGRTMRSLFPDSEDEDGGDYDDDDTTIVHKWTSNDIVVDYHLSCMALGHGDVVWNSGYDISELLVSETGRSKLFGSAGYQFPFTKVLEFGAGAALPSLVCAKAALGKNVTITDQFEEGVFKAINLSVAKNQGPEVRVDVKAHTWGESVDDLVAGGKFDLMVASDCIYFPGAHKSLLSSASKCVGEGGLWVVGFSLHGNVKETETLNFFQLAKAENWIVEREFKIEHEVQEAATWSSVERRGDVCIKILRR